jgi:superoxide dismutase, Cu-Zn family
MKIRNALLLLPIVMMAACGRTDSSSEGAVSSASQSAAMPSSDSAAQVSLTSASGSSVQGMLQLKQEGSAVRVSGELSGLTPGTEHGFHFHETGDCSAPDASSAGGHFNPTNAAHGGPTTAEKHLGDLPNILANSEGNALVDASVEGASLRDGGMTDLVGRALVVHAKRDDYTTQPAGDSGDRIACGVIW